MAQQQPQAAAYHTMCTACMEEMLPSQAIAMIPSCGHAVHLQCLVQEFNATQTAALQCHQCRLQYNAVKVWAPSKSGQAAVNGKLHSLTITQKTGRCSRCRGWRSRARTWGRTWGHTGDAFAERCGVASRWIIHIGLHSLAICLLTLLWLRVVVCHNSSSIPGDNSSSIPGDNSSSIPGDDSAGAVHNAWYMQTCSADGIDIIVADGGGTLCGISIFYLVVQLLCLLCKWSCYA